MGTGLAEEAYERMNRAERQQFWRSLYRLLHWRAWTRSLHHLGDDLDAIAELLSNNGCEVEEYC
jgi:hypothetical protein